MSLVGNLEDLGLGEILQIVSLSRKSGVLTLRCHEKEGKIFFSDGQVTRASVNTRRENFGEILVHRGLAGVEAVSAAAQAIQSGAAEGSLAEVLAADHGVPLEKVNGLAKETVEGVVYGFFAWEEGTFSFELGDALELGEGPGHPLHFNFPDGLNPQWLAMEGSRLLDEMRHRGESPDAGEDIPAIAALGALMAPVGNEASPAADDAMPLVSTTAAPIGTSEPTGGATLYLIDDDDVTRDGLAKAFERLGVACRVFADATSYRGALQQLAPGEGAVALIDLIMPRADGSGILGGLELLESVRREHPELPVLIVSDHPNPEAEQRVRTLGVTALLHKPKKSEVRTPAGAAALDDLAISVIARLPGGGAAGAEPKEPSSDLFNLGEEMRLEFGEGDADFVPSRGPQSPGLHLLRGMLAELQNPALGGGIILLVLRFASELMNRAVIFVVKESEIVGLGQFGIESSHEPADVLVRKMCIPRGAGSVFDRLVAQMAVQRVQLGASEWDNYLRTQLGGGNPAEVFLGPIISEGKVVAILYGDNLPAQTPVGDTESLEIFLSQAGIAMEKALLERRLRVKSED